MKVESKKIEYDIRKEDEKKYLFIPLEIPENVETIEIIPSYIGQDASATVTDEEKNVIDFGLVDENSDDIGSSGSNTRKIIISKSFASDGYKRKEPKGIWKIIVGCYQVKSQGTKVSYDIKFIFKEFRFLKGDTHTHTTNSDGKYPYLELVKKAKKKGLDFLFITDHNNSTQGLPIPVIDGMSVIPGLELTNYDCHINLLGVRKPYKGSYVGDIDEVNKKLVQAKENGAVRVVNHPFCFMCPCNWDLDKIDYDVIEIWNGPVKTSDMKAGDWWQNKLEQGARIPVIGGSDYHRDYYITNFLASPTTRVWADSNDTNTILKAIKNGHSVITKTPDSTMIEINCGNKTVGDVVKLNGKAKVNITVSKMKKGQILQVFTKDGLAYEEKNSGNSSMEYSIEVSKPGFVRAQVIYNKNKIEKLLHKLVVSTFSKAEAKKPIPPLFHALTNPIYFE